MAGHPAPIVAAMEVLGSDECVPAAARSTWKLAERAGWHGRLSYALGTDLRPDGAAGAVVSSVALWCRARGTPGRAGAYAVWLTRARAICPVCGGDFLPLDSGLFRAHGGGCEGGGQVARARRVDDPDAVTSTGFWFARARGFARGLAAAEFRAVLRGELAPTPLRRALPLAVEFHLAMAGLSLTIIDDQ